jgi:hypothetical protein
MTEKNITVQLEFTADEDPDFGEIKTVSVPRSGDLIRTPHGLYQVDKILFDNINVKMGCLVTAIVSPSQYQIPSAKPKVRK